MKALFASRYFLWALQSIPAIGMMVGVTRGSLTFQAALHPTGEFSVRMMIIAMLASPAAGSAGLNRVGATVSDARRDTHADA